MTPILFVDRDGTLIEEPADFQIDAYEKLRFVEGVIPAMLKLRDAGFQFVLVTNQDGLGTASFPRENFEGPHALMIQILASQGITFREELIDEEQKELKARFKDALKTLKTSSLYRGRSERWRSDLPWYLLIGQQGSGQ